MKSKQSHKLVDLESMIRPIVRLLLHFRISLNAVTSILKKLYLEESKKKIEAEGRSLSVPELAYESGCSDIALVSDFLKGRRRTVREIGNLADTDTGLHDPSPPLSLEAAVLERWRNDQDYIDSDGNPVKLPVRGTGKPSFDALVRRCVSGKMSYGPILKNLKKSGAVKYNSNDDTIALANSKATRPRDAAFGRGLTLASPGSLIDASIDGRPIKLLNAADRDEALIFSTFCRSLSHLATTLADNCQIQSDPDKSLKPYTRLQVEYYSTLVPLDRFWEFQSFTTEKMIDAIGEWAAESEARFEQPPKANTIPAGFGIYIWDLRTDVFDTDRIGAPIVKPQR